MSNRLAGAASPYLRQHADNPVDWYPWGAEALERARADDKPILLSIGYAACHWCHVMAHESFEDPELAAWLAERFVAVKVDREERPDLDAIYMTAVQAFTGGHGGWPMTVFLLADGRPFLAGTYFPPVPRHGLPSFRQVCEHALQIHRHDPARRDELAARATERIEAGEAVPELRGERPAVDWLAQVFDAAVEDFDDVHGGFGAQPKFPPHGTLAALLAHHHRTGAEDALRMITGTLDGMARGGVYDLLGGGFARYSVDDAWRVPHFEKMLFDNAQLVPSYVDGWRVTGRPAYARVARETVGYLLGDLSHPEGGFLASEDADSEGVEGRFYVWTPDQIAEVLGGDAPRVAELLQVDPRGTFEHGTSVLRLQRPLEELAPADRDLLVAALPRLLEARGRRARPGVDDKVVTAWNGLAIRALAVAGAALGEPSYVDRAVRCADFLLGRARPGDRLARVWARGAPRGPGFLDDHAALALALVDLYEATFDTRWLREALALAEATLDLFWDEPSGTCHYVGRDAERLVATPRRLVGGAEPSGNGLLAWALARLAVLCGREDLGAVADRILLAYAAYAERAPRAIGYEAVAWAWRTGATREVGLVAPAGADDAPLLGEVRRRADPLRVIARVRDDARTPLVPWMADRPAQGGRATLYVCTTGTCRRPVTTPEEAREELAAAGG